MTITALEFLKFIDLSLQNGISLDFFVETRFYGLIICVTIHPNRDKNFIEVFEKQFQVKVVCYSQHDWAKEFYEITFVLNDQKNKIIPLLEYLTLLNVNRNSYDFFQKCNQSFMHLWVQIWSLWYLKKGLRFR